MLLAQFRTKNITKYFEIYPNCSTLFSFFSKLFFTSLNYLPGFFLPCKNLLNCTTLGITIDHPLVFFCKVQNIFFHCFFSFTHAITNNGTFASEPLHTCRETHCSITFFFKRRILIGMKEKRDVVPGLRP